MKKSTSGLKKPFFAGFLENQLPQDSTNGVQGGGETSKIADQPQTLKYPSDQEDNPTDKYKDVDLTKKYPSDLEDA